MKKIIILVMYCNDEFFIEQEAYIRGKWAKCLIDEEYPNIRFYSYTASTDGKYHISKKDHRILVPSGDGLYDTAEKTYKCLRLLDAIGEKYDYVFRTNTSTYVNVKLLNEFVQTTYSPDAIYCAQIYSTYNFSRPYKFCLIMQGNAMLLSRKNIDYIIDKENISNAYKQLKIANTATGENFDMTLQDDSVMSAVLNSMRIANREDHSKYYNSFGWCPDFDDNISDFIVISFRKHYCDEELDKAMRFEDFQRCDHIHETITRTGTLERTNDLLFYNNMCILRRSLDFDYDYMKYGIQKLKEISKIPYLPD